MAITMKAARVNVGMTQKEAAKNIGISVATLQNYESGKQYPDVPIIKRIEDVYKVAYQDLIFLPQNHA